jgi:hypothetical protein
MPKTDDYTVNGFIIELNTDDKDTDDRDYINNITATIMDISNEFIKRHSNINLCSSQGLSELLKDIGRKYKADINNIKELDILWDIYTIICCTCRIKPTLLRYCMMVSINRDTLNSWLKGEYEGRIASGHSVTVQKWKSECESSLYDEVIQTGNIGCMFALKANYGYRDNVQIIAYDDKAGKPDYSRAEIEDRAKSMDLLPGSADELPD